MQLLCYSVAMVPLPPALLAVVGCCWFYILFRSCHHWCCFFRCWFIFALKMFIDFVVALLLALLLLLGECCIFLQFLLNVSHFLTALRCIASSYIVLPCVASHCALLHCVTSCSTALFCVSLPDADSYTAIAPCCHCQLIVAFKIVNTLATSAAVVARSSTSLSLSI